MNRLLDRLPKLQSTLVFPGPERQLSVRSSDPTSDVVSLIRAIKRKAHFADMHMALLKGIVWDHVDCIGRRTNTDSMPEYLSVRLSEACLVIEHPTAVIDHVYLAFDGLIAALVNMTDTFGRLINLAHSLGVDQRRASLRAVRAKVESTSPLGRVLNDSQYMGWLYKVRDMRGRCQHADVEDVLTCETGPYARREQPYVVSDYCWTEPAHATPVVAYAEEAIRAAANCMVAVAEAIISTPSTASLVSTEPDNRGEDPTR